jgi:hypothetical protein
VVVVVLVVVVVVVTLAAAVTVAEESNNIIVINHKPSPRKMVLFGLRFPRCPTHTLVGVGDFVLLLDGISVPLLGI